MVCLSQVSRCVVGNRLSPNKFSRQIITTDSSVEPHPPIFSSHTFTSLPPTSPPTMKLDPTVMRTMGKQDFRVLAAVESGMKNHSLVPIALVNSIANLRHGGTNKILSSLLRDKLLSHDQSCGYDGYRLTNCGYDILALWGLKSRGIIAGLGDKIGTGKERLV